MAVALVLDPAGRAAAHSPHDDIFDIAVVAGDGGPATIFVVSRGLLFRSNGETGWDRLVNGLDNTADLTTVAGAPTAPDRLYVASRGIGVWATQDGGDTWARTAGASGPRDVTALVVAPDRPNLVLAVDAIGARWRSVDGARTWRVGPGLDARSIAIGADGRVRTGHEDGHVERSDDGGATWTEVNATDRPVLAVTLAPDDHDQWYVGADGGVVLVTEDDGVTFAPVGWGLPDGEVRSIVIADAGSGAALFATIASSGVYALDGDRWALRAEGLSTSDQNEEPEHSDRPDFGILRASPPADDRDGARLYLAGFDGLFHSDDEGRTWQESSTLSTSIVVGLALSPDYGRDGTLVLTTYVNGAFISRDRGRRWTPIDDGLEEPVPMQTADDHFARMFGVAFSPAFTKDGVLFSSTSSALLTTATAGRRWDAYAPPDADQVRVPRQLIVAVSPRFADDRMVFFADVKTGAVLRSTDGGGTFHRIATMDPVPRSLVVQDGPDGIVLLAGTRTGAEVSVDHGVSWRSIGPADHAVTDLAVAPSGGTVLAGTPSGLFASHDGGTNWATVDLGGASNLGIGAVAMSPDFERDGTVLVSARGRGLFRSVDGGRTYTAIAPQLAGEQVVIANFPKPTGPALVFSPDFARDRTVYGFAGTTLLRSEDAGSSWATVAFPVARHAMPTDPARARPSGPGHSARRVAVVGTALVAGWAVAVHRRSRRGRVGSRA